MDQPSIWISTCMEISHVREITTFVIGLLLGLLIGFGVMGWAYSDTKKDAKTLPTL
jgi:hypothetical protein